MEADRFSHFVGELESWCGPAAPRPRQDSTDTGLVSQTRREALLSKVKSRLAESCPLSVGAHSMVDVDEDDVTNW